MFDRHEEQLDPVKELNAIHGADTHIKEYTKQHRHGDESQQWRHEHGHTDQDGDGEGANSLLFHFYQMWFLTWCMGTRHHRDGGHMCNRPYSSSADPRGAQETAANVEQTDEHNVKMETGALTQFTFFLVDNQPVKSFCIRLKQSKVNGLLNQVVIVNY